MLYRTFFLFFKTWFTLGFMALYMVSGKGGVGKTHVSMALGCALSELGKKVLVVEFSQLSQYSVFFAKPVGFKALKIKENLHISTWTGLDCLAEYAGAVIGSQKTADLFLSSALMKKIISVAPGLKEVAVLGKLTADYRNFKIQTGYEDIVFDAPSSGHFLSLLKVPFGLLETVGAGPMKTQSEAIMETLKDSDKVKMLLVQDESRFSASESDELEESLTNLLGPRKVTRFLNFASARPDLGLQKIEAQMSWFEKAKKSALSLNLEQL